MLTDPIPVASMGPRPFGRGRAEGAYARGVSRVSLQWGRDLSVAEGSQLGRLWPNRLSASMGPRPFGRGRRGTDRSRARRRTASMGPRPFGRGRIAISPRAGPAADSFNGAATFRSRKASYAAEVQKEIRALQWGRDLSVAEGMRILATGRPPIPASMGPRPFGRGRPACPACRRLVARFNGAATFRSRKVYWPDTMFSVARLLQWGRDLSVAEGVCICHHGRAHHKASMGPRPFGRGRLEDAEVAGVMLQASMGPRPFGRGRREAGSRPAARGPASMGPRPFGRGRLYYRHHGAGVAKASMGPRPFGRGRGAVRQRQVVQL